MRPTKSASGTGKEMIDSTGFSQEKSAEGPQSKNQSLSKAEIATKQKGGKETEPSPF